MRGVGLFGVIKIGFVFEILGLRKCSNKVFFLSVKSFSKFVVFSVSVVVV